MVFTQKEKDTLLHLVNNVPVSGNRKEILAILEELAALARKIEALPIEEVKQTEPASVAEAPAQPPPAWQGKRRRR